MTLREQFEKEYNWVDKKEQPMFMSVKYIHWLEAKIKQLQNTSSNSDYVKSCDDCIYGVDGCQHEPPCTTGTGKPYYKKRDFA